MTQQYEAPDWDREKPRRFWDPSRKLLRTTRLYQTLKMSQSLFAHYAYQSVLR